MDRRKDKRTDLLFILALPLEVRIIVAIEEVLYQFIETNSLGPIFKPPSSGADLNIIKLL